jgi:hypothetical protein
MQKYKVKSGKSKNRKLNAPAGGLFLCKPPAQMMRLFLKEHLFDYGIRIFFLPGIRKKNT